MCNDEKEESRTERKNEEKCKYGTQKIGKTPMVLSHPAKKTAPSLTCWCMIDLEEGMLMRAGRGT